MAEPKSANIKWHHGNLTQGERETVLNQKGAVVWFTGFSGSGKSTVSRIVEAKLLQRGVHAYVLDGDNLRFGLNKDLGFSAEDRKENIRRVGNVAQLFADAGMICLTAFISPYRADRQAARDLVKPGRFLEAHVATSIAACEARDPKGLYAKVRAGEIANFTGVDAPYEQPEDPEIRVFTEGRTPEESAQMVLDYLEAGGFIPAA